jgi:hypothetical protein
MEKYLDHLGEDLSVDLEANFFLRHLGSLDSKPFLARLDLFLEGVALRLGLERTSCKSR